MLIVIIIIIED